MTTVSNSVEMKDADIYLREAIDRYLNNDNFAGWFAESNALSIVRYLADKKNAQAIEAKKVMLSDEDDAKFKRIQAEQDSSLAQKRTSEKQFDIYETRDYNNYIETYGLQKADERKALLKKTKTDDIARYNNAVKAFDDELKKIKRQAPTRFNAYITLRGDSFANGNEDPLVLLNKVIADVNEAYPEYNYSAFDMNEQVQKLYGNYTSDVKHLNSVHTLLSDLNENLIPTIEKKIQNKERQQKIQEYYHKQYEGQIFLAKILIVFAMFALVGFLLLHYEWIPLLGFMAYLGIVFSVAFIVFFYYLWDFYMRDSQVFDEYNFNTYLPPSSGKHLQSTFKDNIIYC